MQRIRLYLAMGVSVLSIFSGLLLSHPAHADFNPDDLIEARIENINRDGLLQLTRMGVDIDSVSGNTARIYLSSDLLKKVRDLGYQVTISKASPYKYGRFQGYHSYSALTDELKAVAAAHPDISRLYSIGKSYEGRDLWFMKISDNVNTEEDEPEVKYISTMHGDEPVGMELSLNLIHLLTDSYKTDPRIAELVNGLEIWIMPLMNPDGYVHETRYNMQGKDLNRSFPDRVFNPYDTVTGRPVETQLLMEWGYSHSPVLAANFHTGVTVVNYPYDSDPNPYLNYSATPDDALFIQLALAYASSNKTMYNSNDFNHGITNGVEWYYVYGGMQDWNYLWRGCNEITIELSDVKSPSFSEIAAIWDDNRESMLSYMEWSLRGIRGIVSDADTGKPLKATIHVAGNSHEEYTDPDVGDYHRIFVPGTYSLCFSADGYAPETIENIVVNQGKATRIDVSLSSIGLQNVIAILRILTGLTPDISGMSSDFDKNGKIAMEDTIYALQVIAGLRRCE